MRSTKTLVTVSVVLAILLTLVVGAIVALTLLPKTPAAPPEPTAAATAQTAFAAETEVPETVRQTEVQLGTLPPETTAPPRFCSVELRGSVEAALADRPAPWIVYARSLTSDDEMVYGKQAGADDPMIAASIIKIFIMAAVWDRVEQGLLAEADVAADVEQMITVSSNDAANRLTRRLGDGDAAAGRKIVTDFAASIGCTAVQHNRLMLEDNGTQNYVSAADCATLLRLIYEGRCVSPARSEAMLATLLAQKDHDYIPAGVPAGVPIAHKGGDLMNCQGDVGIVFADNGPYIVCIITNSSLSAANTAAIGEVSRMIYEAMTTE